MTDLVPDYETSGPLTVCPCCGGRENLDDRCDYSCWSCWRKHGGAMPWPESKSEPIGRAWMAAHGFKLRAAGTLPPLTCATRELETPAEKTRWGIVYEHCGTTGWAVGEDPSGFWLGTREACEAKAEMWNARRGGSGATYTVKPYPGPAAHAVPDPKPREQPVTPPGQPTKPADPYTAHRLASEATREATDKALALARREADKWAAEVVRLEGIRRVM